jgi:hypothetical protein
MRNRGCRVNGCTVPRLVLATALAPTAMWTLATLGSAASVETIAESGAERWEARCRTDGTMHLGARIFCLHRVPCPVGPDSCPPRGFYRAGKVALGGCQSVGS